MIPNEKAPAASTTETLEQSSAIHTTKTRRHRKGKQYKILKLLSEGHSLNRFEALSAGDSALNSTISTLQETHELYVARTWETVPNRFGGKTRCCRYRLMGENLERARSIIRNWG